MSFGYVDIPFDGVPTYSSPMMFPPSASDGALAIDLTTDILYIFNLTTMTWIVLASPGGAGGGITALNGDVSATGPGIATATIQPNVVTNSKLAQMPSDTIKGNNTGSTANASDLTVAQVKTLLNLSGTNSGDVTLGTANGLSLSGQILSLGLSSTSTTGALDSTDWNTFNNKQPAGNYIVSPANLTSQVTGVLPIANGGTNSGTPLTNGQVMVSSAGEIIENPNIYSVLNGGLSIGAPLSNPDLGETSFGVYKASTTTSTVEEYPSGVYYALNPASTQTGDYFASAIEIALNPPNPTTSMNGYYYGNYVDAAAQNGAYGGPVIGGLNYVHFDNNSSGVLSLGQQVTVLNDGTGEVHNSWGISIDTVQATGVGPNAHRAALLMLGDHTFLGSNNGATASGSTVSNECDAIYVRAGCLNATGTGAANWVINSQETHPSLFMGSISAQGLITTTLQATTGATSGYILTSDSAGNGTWQAPATSGTVTSVSIVSANGLAGTVATSTTTPAITLSTTVTGILKGNGTAITAATAGTDYVIPSGSITGTSSNITATTNSTLTTLYSLSLPGSQVTGNISGDSANITGTVAIANGGTNATTINGARASLGITAGFLFITAGTTYTTPSTITTNTNFKFTLVGGGAGGSSSNLASTHSTAGGSGGGATLFFTGLVPSTAYTIAIGSAGSGGTSGNVGGSGGNTSITISSVTYSANGGNAAVAVTGAGGIGGNTTNCGAPNMGINGASGGTSMAVFTSGGLPGGTAPWGWGFGGAGIAPSTAANGNAATGYGAGGGGSSSNGAPTGGSGSQGAILVEYWN